MAYVLIVMYLVYSVGEVLLQLVNHREGGNLWVALFLRVGFAVLVMQQLGA
jgi:hypothetical protein